MILLCLFSSTDTPKTMLKGHQNKPNEGAPKQETKKKTTMDDMHSELREKYESPNRGLKPIAQRALSDPLPKPGSAFQQIFDDFKAKIQAKSAKN